MPSYLPLAPPKKTHATKKQKCAEEVVVVCKQACRCALTYVVVQTWRRTSVVSRRCAEAFSLNLGALWQPIIMLSVFLAFCFKTVRCVRASFLVDTV